MATPDKYSVIWLWNDDSLKWVVSILGPWSWKLPALDLIYPGYMSVSH
nr:MAG: hypothetical protein H1Rhizo26FD3113_000002 [Mitovirus sp.]